jgi:two-component system chemotaxis response regulator CheB
MENQDIIVIGTSAGGVVALLDLVKSLPKDFDASIFLVQHITPFSHSNLSAILNRHSPIPAAHAIDGETIQKGKIYVAPADHHLLLEDDKVLVKKGPKENRFRPSIDALFRSAAYMYGNRVIGVILSGLLDDGTSGLWTIKRLGGTCIIQEPDEAEFPSMPKSVLEYVEVDHVLPVSEIGPLLHQLSKQPVEEKPMKLTKEELKRLLVETNIAAQDNAFEMGILNLGKFTPFTCPECNGALVEIKEGKFTRFRCHTGHAFSDTSLLAGITKSIEDDLWQTVRGLEEAVLLLEQLGKQIETNGEQDRAKSFYRKAREMQKQSQAIRSHIFQQQRMGDDLSP